MRPHVVLFGEMVNEDELIVAYESASSCDICIVVGTSSMVHPANMIPTIAKREGAMIIEINPEKTELTDLADFSIQAKAAKILPELLISGR
jgi:NAD-dependent deacetylase